MEPGINGNSPLFMAYKRTGGFLGPPPVQAPVNYNNIQTIDSIITKKLGWRKIQQHERRKYSAMAARMAGTPDDVIDVMLRHKRTRAKKSLRETYTGLLVRSALYQKMAAHAVSEVLQTVVDSPEATWFVRTQTGYTCKCLPNPDFFSIQDFLKEKKREEEARDKKLGEHVDSEET